MDEYNQNFNLENDSNEEQTIQEQDTDITDNTNEVEEKFSVDEEPVWNKVEYTPVGKIEDYKPMGRGLKIFCLVMAAVIALTATTAAGYFMGRSSVSNNYIGALVDVDFIVYRSPFLLTASTFFVPTGAACNLGKSGFLL